MTTARPLGGALGHRAVDEHVLGQPGGDRQRRRHDGPHLGRSFPAAVVPVERQAERVLHLGRGRAAEPRRPGAHAGVGREPVDVVAGQAGVGNGGQCGVHREIQVGASQTTADVGLSDARNDGAPLQGLLRRTRAHDASSTGVKSGSQTSSTCSKSTRTGMPMRTSSGSTSTRFVVRRTSGCSSIETQAMM